MIQRVAILTILTFALTDCGALGGSSYDEALRLWQARPLSHYLLRTYEVVGGHPCGQIVEVRDEALVRIISDTCQHPTLWTVSWLFNYAGKAHMAVERCARLALGAGCVCRDAVDLQVAYDPILGYPREIITRQTWQAAWQRPSYWMYVARHGKLPDCTPPFIDPGRQVVVRELRPLP
jgi:hypothetical protein